MSETSDFLADLDERPALSGRALAAVVSKLEAAADASSRAPGQRPRGGMKPGPPRVTNRQAGLVLAAGGPRPPRHFLARVPRMEESLTGESRMCLPWQAWTTIGTLILAVGTIALAAAAIYSAKLTRHSVELTRVSVENQERVRPILTLTYAPRIIETELATRSRSVQNPPSTCTRSHFGSSGPRDSFTFPSQSVPLAEILLAFRLIRS
jgi:hypothetical protein